MAYIETLSEHYKLVSSALCYRDINIQIRHAVGVELKPSLHWQILVCRHVFLYSAENPQTTEDKIQAQTTSADENLSYAKVN